MIDEQDIHFQSSNPFVQVNQISLKPNFNQNQNGRWPQPRYKHQTFIYNNKLFVHGGTAIPSSNFIDDSQYISYYDLDNNTYLKWDKEFETVSGHAGVVEHNKFYIFGGSNSNCKQNNLLFRLNLDTYEWNKMQQKGEVPSVRQCAFFMYLQKNWLVLYGGVSNNLVQIYNTFHFYNIETRYWSKCEDSYIYQAHSRLNSALCSIKNKLYMFGGTYRNRRNEEKFLNDFYQFTLTTPAKNFQGKIKVKRLISNTIPEARSGHNLVSLGNNYLILFGGQNQENLKQNFRYEEVNLVKNMWIYNIEINTWVLCAFKKQNSIFRTMATCNMFQNKLYIFGGLTDYSSVLNDLNQISVDLQQLSKHGRRTNPCLKCYEKSRLTKTEIAYSSNFIDQISNNIQFPFAAFGLLVDNAMTCGASHINIHFHEKFGSQKVNTIRIQDNSKIKWTDDQLIDAIINYESNVSILPNGVDKKIKTAVLKQNHRRQYGMNLKSASLRLGQSFLFVNLSPTEFYYRIILIEKTNLGTPNQKYIVYFYTYCWYDRNDINPDMIQTRNYVESKYYDYIKDTFLHKYAKNTVFIFNPRVGLGKNTEQEEFQMKIYKDYNDILYGNLSKIQQLFLRNGNVILQSVDISLRAYLTCLYLKNDSVTISLGIKYLPLTQIQTQVFLQKVDKLCRSKHVLEISQVFQYDLKIIELFYLYDLKRKFQFFSNGLLIYHKNRLIMRYKYPLGQLFSRKYYMLQKNHNFFRLFGFIELPEHISINMYKTGCIYPITLEKIMIRMKCISKYFKKQLQNMVIEPQYKRNAPSKLNDKELQQINKELQSEQNKKKLNKPRSLPMATFRQSKRLSQKGKIDSNNNISQERSDNIKQNLSNNFIEHEKNDQLSSDHNKLNLSAQKPQNISRNEISNNQNESVSLKQKQNNIQNEVIQNPNKQQINIQQQQSDNQLSLSINQYFDQQQKQKMVSQNQSIYNKSIQQQQQRQQNAQLVDNYQQKYQE